MDHNIQARSEANGSIIRRSSETGTEVTNMARPRISIGMEEH